MARLVISLPRFGIRVDELSSTRVTGPPPQLSAGTEPSFRFPWWSATWRWGSPRKSASLRPSLSSPVRFQRKGCKGCKWCKLTCSCLHWETMVDTHGRSQWMHSWPVPKWDRYTEKPILDHRREYHFLPFQRQVSCPWTRSQAGHLPRNLRSWGALTRTFKRISMKTYSIKWKVEKFHGTNIFSASGYIHNHHLQSGSSPWHLLYAVLKLQTAACQAVKQSSSIPKELTPTCSNLISQLVFEEGTLYITIAKT